MSLSHSAFALEALRNALYKFKTYLLLRLYAEGIHFSTHDLTNFTVYMGCCSSSCWFHPPCPKSLDWIDIQSNWFSLTFSRSTFQTIPAFECPLSSTSMFLRIQYKSESLLFFSLTPTSSFLSVILLVYWMLLFQRVHSVNQKKIYPEVSLIFFQWLRIFKQNFTWLLYVLCQLTKFYSVI